MIDDKYAYILIPGLVTTEKQELSAKKIVEIIQTLDARDPLGWIVDLRQNVGGNMWPMLLGLGPIMGEGVVGSFQFPDGHHQNWYYSSGKVLMGRRAIASLEGSAYCLKFPNPAVAVLTSGRTASSGEAIAVAFRGRPNARSFGEATYGLSTANEDYDLCHGMQMHLTVATFADRTGAAYGKAIIPDQIVSELQSDPITEAKEWLSKQRQSQARG